MESLNVSLISWRSEVSLGDGGSRGAFPYLVESCREGRRLRFDEKYHPTHSSFDT